MKTILKKIQEIHEEYSDADFNMILEVAAKKMGYENYNSYITDGDLLEGLYKIKSEDMEDVGASCFGYYEGTLI